MYTFTDEYGEHQHETSVPGRAYDQKVEITCESCIRFLTARSDAWQAELTKRHNLPEGFWDGYKRTWEK